MIIDSHCHLDYPELFNQLDDIIARAENNDVKRFLTICTTLESFEKIKIITQKFENIYGTYGIHPHETKKNTDINKHEIINQIKKNKKIIGIGETGLDYYYNHSDKEIQKKSFSEHLNAASELGIPVIVHTRNAESDTFDILQSVKKNSKIKVLIHCFTGSGDFAKKLLDLGCYISISGIITFKKSYELSKVVTDIPLDNLLVETDSPYLSPDPYRGKSNEPSYIINTVKKLAEIKNLTENEIALKTTNNFIKLFNIK